MLNDDIPQLAEKPHVGIVIRTAPIHMRLQRVQPRKLRPDRGNVITDVPAVDVMIYPAGVGGSHSFLPKKSMSKNIKNRKLIYNKKFG